MFGSIWIRRGGVGGGSLTRGASFPGVSVTRREYLENTGIDISITWPDYYSSECLGHVSPKSSLMPVSEIVSSPADGRQKKGGIGDGNLEPDHDRNRCPVKHKRRTITPCKAA